VPEAGKLKPEARFLLLWREVSSPRPYLKVFLQRRDFDGAVSSVRIEVGRLVGNHILAAQLIFDGGEGACNVFHLEGKEDTSASRIGKLLEDPVAAHDQAAIVGRNRINDHFRPLRHLDGLCFRNVALVILTITHDDNGFSHRPVIAIFQKLLFARAVDSVVERRPSTVM